MGTACEDILPGSLNERADAEWSTNLTLPDYGRFARDTTKCVSAAQQRVARRRVVGYFESLSA